MCGTVMVDAGEQVGIAIYVFRGEYRGGELASSAEGTLEWLPVSELGHLPLVEDLYFLIPKVLKTGPGDPPFAGLYDYDDNDVLRVSFS